VLRIRLQRSGRKNRPTYRIVVAEHTAPIKGSYIDFLGSFDPLVEKHGMVVDVAKVEEWIKKGAQPTNTVARLLKGKGVKGMESFIIEMKDKAIKNPKEEAAPAAPAAEAPAEAPQG
jgi:small subunit ribosomal protein S16